MFTEAMGRVQNTKNHTVKQQLKNLIFLTVVAVALVVGVGAVIVSTISIKEDYRKAAVIATSHLRDALENGQANWSYDAETGTVYSGDTALTVDLFDTIHNSDETVYHTIFWDNTRVLTNIKNESGAYAVGTTADDAIYKNVKAGNTYSSNGVAIFGAEYTVCYMPIYNNGSFCGMVFTGIEQSAVVRVIIKLAAITAVFGVVLLVAMMFISGKILNRVSGLLTDKLEGGYNNLNEFAGDVRGITNRTNKEVADITIAMNNVASGATGQAAATEQAMASTEEFSADIDVVNEEISGSYDVLSQIKSCVKDSEDSIGELNENINTNNEIVSDISTDIANGVQCSHNAKAVVKTIDDLAFQINLLALNAAVEASHAGEYGRGFAVVADEIKNLANNSARSASETEDIIGEIVDTMTKTSEANEKLVEANKLQLRKAAEVSERMDALKENIENIIGRLDNIKNKADALAAVKGELVTVVQNLSATAEENAAVSQEVCASSETVGRDVDDLKNKVDSVSNICGEMKSVIEFFG